MIQKRFNKKGTFHSELVVQTFSYIAFFMVFLIFLLIFGVKGCSDQHPAILSGQVNGIDANVMLINYLRTPIDVDTTMADLISRTPEDYNLIIAKTEKIFNGLGGENAFQILLNIDENKCIFDCGNVAMAACAAKYNLNKISIPTLKGDSLNISICFWSDDDVKTQNYECRKRTRC